MIAVVLYILFQDMNLKNMSHTELTDAKNNSQAMYASMKLMLNKFIDIVMALVLGIAIGYCTYVICVGSALVIGIGAIACFVFIYLLVDHLQSLWDKYVVRKEKNDL